MKKYSLLFLVIICTLPNLFGQIQAVTEKGDTVILNSDRTWIPLSEHFVPDEIPLSDKVYEKSKQAKSLVSGGVVEYELHYDKTQWNPLPQKPNPASEFGFANPTADAYLIVIPEPMQIPIVMLQNIALENAKSVDPFTKVNQVEYRMVNGQKILMMEFEASNLGIDFTYIGYYYSGEKGSIQFLSYTYSNEFEKNKEAMVTLLNGAVIPD